MTRVVFRSMGCDVVVEKADDERVGAIRELFEHYDATFSRFRADSELTRLNTRGGGRMSSLFADVLEVARWAAEETAGIVDPTVGAAVVAAGYDRDFGECLDDARAPGDAAPADHRAVRTFGRLLVLPRGVQLDLNGVVKALAVDRAATLLGGDGFVSAGGDLATRGAVDVALPGGGAVRVVGGVATSGTGQRRWLRGGEPQHHLIDARRGRPARSRWQLVTVCGATCLSADVAAKAALLRSGDGPGWLEERGLPGRLVDEDGAVVETEHWRAALVEAVCT